MWDVVTDSGIFVSDLNYSTAQRVADALSEEFDKSARVEQQ